MQLAAATPVFCAMVLPEVVYPLVSLRIPSFGRYTVGLETDILLAYRLVSALRGRGELNNDYQCKG